MAKMTKSIAMTTVTNLINDVLSNPAALEALEYTKEQQDKLSECLEPCARVKAQADKPRTTSAEAAEKQAQKAAERKVATAKARAELVATVAPILRKHLVTDVTVKELTEAAAPELPADFTWHKVQNMLSRELAPELVRTERKKGGDLYRLA